jgi:endonuclease/exonuclease/phosphatase family metal-dependent hydrolase
MRIVTYNIHYGVGRDGYHDLDRIADAIDGADVIALQEVERFWPRSGMVDQPQELGKRLPDYWWVYGPNVDLHSATAFPGEASRQRRQFGNMLLSRTPLLGSENVRLPRLQSEPRSMRRGALEAIATSPRGTELRIASTHLCYLSAQTRIAQAEAIFDRHHAAAIEGGSWHGEHPSDPSWYLGDEPEMPASAIVLGDMNFGEDTTEYAATVGRRNSPLAEAWPLVRPGHPGTTKDGNRIDQAWITGDLVPRLVDAWIDGVADGSDHQPVWFELDL